MTLPSAILSSNGMAFDLAEEIAATSRFVIVDHYEISGGGIIREALEMNRLG